jgi:hypothetical protein
VWRFVLLLVVVAVGSYYAARFLLEGFLARISRKKGPEDPR